MSKKVLMVAPNYFTSTFQVGSNHYARAFEKLGYEVLFISHPISPFHKFFSKAHDLADRVKIHGNMGEKKGKINYYVPYSFLVPQNLPFFSSRWVLDNWHRFSKPNLFKFIRNKGFSDVDILWFDSSLYGFLLSFIKFEKSILRIADFSKGFDAVSKNQYLKEIDIGKKVDKIVITAKSLEKKYNGLLPHEKIVYIPNGIDLDFFSKMPEAGPSEMPMELLDIPEPRVIYVGAIDKWFDLNLLVKTAFELPNFNFVIIGPPKINISIAKKFRNIHFLGPINYEMIPRFLFYSQVGIIPFNVEDFSDLINSVSPLKIYEYLACGLSVVSVLWEEISNLESFIFFASKTDFASTIQKALTSKKEKFPIEQSDWKVKLKNILEF